MQPKQGVGFRLAKRGDSTLLSSCRFRDGVWYGWRDSNPRPSVPKTTGRFRPKSPGFESDSAFSMPCPLPQSGCRSQSKFAEIEGKFKAFDTLSIDFLISASPRPGRCHGFIAKRHGKPYESSSADRGTLSTHRHCGEIVVPPRAPHRTCDRSRARGTCRGGERARSS